MKRLLIMALIAVTVGMMFNCGNKTAPVPFDNGDSIESLNVDSTVYGICGNATAMNTLQLITDTGDTLQLEITEARQNKQVLGGLQAGDRMAVLTDNAQTKAYIVINQSALLGNWVMPNPIDGSDELGFSIKEGGIAESIEQSGINYKTWRLTYGKLELVLSREDGGDENEYYLYDIVKLGPDSLILKDSEDIYEYGRLKPKKQYEEIELEDASLEDFN